MLTPAIDLWRPLLPGRTEDGVELAPRVEAQPTLPVGPFAHLPDGRIAGRDGERIRLSADGGATWDEGTRFLSGKDEDADADAEVEPEPTAEGAIACSDNGTLVFGFMDRSRKANWSWDEQIHDSPDAELPCCVVRSTDGGATWEPAQTLHHEWTGAVRDIIRTRDGRLVMSSMKMQHDPGRHSVVTYCSDDHGQNWYPSNVIDLGGMGHHGGVTEAALLELQDGALMLLMRTNWGQFWYALSWNGGIGWHPMGPTAIDASSAPGILLRLESGRVALVWNRAQPVAGPMEPFIRGGDGNWSAVPVSNFREELSIAFSEDDCRTWTPPRVIARKPEGTLAYPHLFEPRPGRLWVTTQANMGALRVELGEEDFV